MRLHGVGTIAQARFAERRGLTYARLRQVDNACAEETEPFQNCNPSVGGIQHTTY